MIHGTKNLPEFFTLGCMPQSEEKICHYFLFIITLGDFFPAVLNSTAALCPQYNDLFLKIPTSHSLLPPWPDVNVFS